MDADNTGPEPPGNRHNWHDAGRPVPSGGEETELDAAVVIMAAERELMNARIAVLLAGVERAYRQLIDARADLMFASVHSDADVVADAEDYVDEVKAMFECISR